MFISLPDIVILAGGLGTRLRDDVPGIPKAMAPVNQKPFLEYQLNFINKAGFKRVILSIGYLGHQIESYFGDHYKDIELIYSSENEPLGTGGAVKLAFQHVVSPHFMVMNGDTMFRISLDYFFLKHIENLAGVSIALRKVENASRYGQVEINNDGQIIAFNEKSEQTLPGLINGGIYLLSSRYFKKLELPVKFSLERDLFMLHPQEQSYLGVVFNDYFLDIGIPNDYQRAQNEFKQFKD